MSRASPQSTFHVCAIVFGSQTFVTCASSVRNSRPRISNRANRSDSASRTASGVSCAAYASRRAASSPSHSLTGTRPVMRFSRSAALAAAGSGETGLALSTADRVTSASIGTNFSKRSSSTPIGFDGAGARSTYGERSTNRGIDGSHAPFVNSSSVFMLVAAIHSSGKMKMPTPVSSSRCSHPRETKYSARGGGAFRARRSARIRSRLLIVHPPFAEPQLRKREHEHDEEQDPRQRRRVAHAEELERVLEQVVGVEQRGVGRAAFGHDVGFAEDLHRRDETDDQVEQDVGAEHRHRDVAEALERAGAVDLDRKSTRLNS